MKWKVAAPYFESHADRWITDSIASQRHSFELVCRPTKQRNWHQSSSNRDGLRDWVTTIRHANQAFSQRDNGVITVYPQLAAAAGMAKMIQRSDRPLVAWLFNTENIRTFCRRTVARKTLSKVDAFVVHTTRESASYSSLLKIPEQRFIFVPQQYGARVETEKPSEADEPYVFATGSAYRDYKTLFAAVDKLSYRTLVLAGDRSLAGLEIPNCVTVLDQISRPEIRRLARHARVNVVPLTLEAETAGIATIVDTFAHQRSVVTTDRPGLEDYIFPGRTALTTRPFDVASMAEALEAVWTDSNLRASLDEQAGEFARQNCTDAAAAKQLVAILDRLT